MNDHDLDQAYTALCQALADVGPDKAPLFLSMLCLALVSRCEHAAEVLPMIANAQAHCQGAARDR